MIETVTFAVAGVLMLLAVGVVVVGGVYTKTVKITYTVVATLVALFCIGCVGHEQITYQYGIPMTVKGQVVSATLESGEAITTSNILAQKNEVPGIRISTRPILYGFAHTHNYAAILAPKED